MSLLAWIKSTIGLSKAPVSSPAPPPHEEHAQASSAPAPEPQPPTAEPSEPPIEAATVATESLRQGKNPPARIEPDGQADAIDVEPAQPIEVKVEIAVAADAPCAAAEPKSAPKPAPKPAPKSVPTSAPESVPAIAIVPDRPPSREEIDRRRAMVRGFFNDYWSSIEDKPPSFAERLDHAENYINERVAAGGEAWRLCAATRKELGLPPSRGG